MSMSRRFAASRVARITSPSGDAVDAAIAEGFAARLMGLAWLPESAARALLIPRCRSVHTFGMRFAIDVAFVALAPEGARDSVPERAATVVAVRPAVPPRRLVAARASGPDGTRIAALELPSGRAAALGIEPSLTIGWRPVDPGGPASERKMGGLRD